MNVPDRQDYSDRQSMCERRMEGEACADAMLEKRMHLHMHIYLQVKKLSSGDWFTSKVSACGLYAACYRVIAPTNGEARQALRAQFEVLAKDDTPMVSF